MRKFAALGLMALMSTAAQAELKPFMSLDYSQEEKRGSIADEYIAANVTIGVKAANKVEYSFKAGLSDKNPVTGTSTISNNIEIKIKKSYDLGNGLYPYVALRLGEKIEATKQFAHYAVDAGIKIPLGKGFAIDIGTRYRNAFATGNNFDSTRYHGMVTYDLTPSDSVGLRYAYSTGAAAESKNSWRVHYAHNF